MIAAAPITGLPNARPAAHPVAEARSAWLWTAAIALIAVLVCLPFARTFVVLSDEGVLPHGAERMLRGQRLYADFFEFLPPGGFLIVESWFRLVGISVLSLRALAILSIAGTACFAFLACRTVSRSEPLAAALTIGWLIMSQGVATQLSHHYLTTCLLAALVWATLSGEAWQGRRPWLAGLAAGAAGMVTPTCAALAMLAGAVGFVGRPIRWRAILAYVLGAAAVPLGVLLYLGWHGTLATAFADAILSPADNYAAIQWVPFGSGADAQSLPLKFLDPAAAGLGVAILAARAWTRLGWRCAAFCAAGWIGSFPRPDIVHIAYGVPLALPFLAWSATRLARGWRLAIRLAAVLAAVAVCVAPAVSWLALAREAWSTPSVPTERGAMVWFGPAGTPAMLARVAALPPEDGVFFYPTMALAPMLTGHEDATPYDTYQPGYTRPSEYQEACRAAIRRAAWVVVDRNFTDPALIRRTFPAVKDPTPPESTALEQVLDTAYDLAARDGKLELRRRRADAKVALCDGIVGK